MKYKGIVLSYFILTYCFGCVFVHEYDELPCKITIKVSEEEYIDIGFNKNDSFALITRVDFFINRDIESELFLYFPKILTFEEKDYYVKQVGCESIRPSCEPLDFSIYIDKQFIKVDKVVLNIYYGGNAFDNDNYNSCYQGDRTDTCVASQGYYLKNSEGVRYVNKNFIELIVNERYY